MPIQLTRRSVLGSFAAVSMLTAAGMKPSSFARVDWTLVSDEKPLQISR